MRHFLIIGSKGAIVGNAVEEFQHYKGYPSGRDPQDYFSNSLGYKIYNKHTVVVQGYSFGGTYSYYDFGGNFVKSVGNFLNNR
jgi:hypothetical protein